MSTRNPRFSLTALAAAASLFAAATSLPATAAARLQGSNNLKQLALGVAGEQAAYERGFLGGVRVGSGDIDGDGAPARAARDWFDPASWVGGQVPGPDDDVELVGSDAVLIDQARNRSGGKVQFRDLIVRDGARFEVIGGAIVETRTQVQADGGRIIFRASGDVSETLVAGATADEAAFDPSFRGGVTQNPNPKSTRIIVLKSSATLDVGLGGTTAAGLTKVGAGTLALAAGTGHYATINTDTAVLDGDLRLSTYYGFEPRPGDSFQIITVNGVRTGQFLGLPEGGYVACTDTSTCLRISYQGGDGNDVVLTADSVRPEIALLLPAVQKVREAASRRSAAAPAITDLGVAPDPTAIGLLLPAVQKVREAAARSSTRTKLPSPTTPISGPKPTPK